MAARAAELAATVPFTERELLVVATWLHDIGYSPAGHDTGFHPLDRARYLRRHGWHHSGAHFAADRLGLRGALDEFEHKKSPVSVR